MVAISQNSSSDRGSVIRVLITYCDRFGHAFMMDSGSSTGEIMGHSKVIYDFRVERRTLLMAVFEDH